MSNSTLSNVLIFAAGAAVGSIVTWKLLKTRYEQIVQEEIDSVYEAIENREKTESAGKMVAEGLVRGIEESSDTPRAINVREDDDGTNVITITLTDGSTHTFEVKNGSKGSYAEKLSKEAYTDYTEAKEAMKVGGPYVIPPEDFGEIDEYETISLTYYADGVLTDEVDDVIEDVDDIVGKDSLDRFGEYEDDSVFVRNDNMKADYEILLDSRNYHEAVMGKRPHLAEDE